MNLTDKFPKGKHKDRSLQTVLIVDILYVKSLVKKGILKINEYIRKTYNL